VARAPSSRPHQARYLPPSGRFWAVCELVAILVPSPLEEAVRDMSRTRRDTVEDLTRARHRLSKFLLRHSKVYRDGPPWTVKHEAWLAAQHLEEPALGVTFGHYRATVAARDAAVAAVEADLATWLGKALRPGRAPLGRLPGRERHGAAGPAGRGLRLAPFWPGGVVHGLCRPGALYMGFVGLVPSGYSSGAPSHVWGILGHEPPPAPS